VSAAFQARPRKIRFVAATAAVLLLALFTVAGVFLRRTDTGVIFRSSDQVAMIGIGVLLALGVLMFARPRVRADANGVEVRNVLGTKTIPWDLVRQVSFPDGAPWARLELPDNEYIPILAIQAIDRTHAVAAMRELRRLHREATART
jgi:PH (Pleckstrin Homology) domain-containing protein